MFPANCPFDVLIRVPFSGPASILHCPSTTSSVNANHIWFCGTLLKMKASSSGDVIVTK